MRSLWCLVALALTQCSFGQQRWYYTGKFENEQVLEQDFDGSSLDLMSLYDHPLTEKAQLYAGGLLVIPFNTSESRDNRTVSLLAGDLDYLRQVTLMGEFELESVVSYRVHLAPNYHLVPEKGEVVMMRAEVGLYDHRKDMFLEKHVTNLTVGTIHAAVLSGVQPTIELASRRRHRVMWTWDVFGRVSLLHHLWEDVKDLTTQQEVEQSTGDERSTDCELDSTVPSNLRIMTYNLWHNNPPSWVYHDKGKRWERYDKRIRHFAAQILLEDPDIVAVQEVRLDSAFSSYPQKNISYWNNWQRTYEASSDLLDDSTGTQPQAAYRQFSASKVDAGSQVEHLLRAIDLEKAAQNLSRQTGVYQALFHPSMLQFDSGRLVYRNEEGLLLLSKYPILHAQAVFLPRLLGEKADDHQRVALVVQVAVPSAQGHVHDARRVVTLVTSHFSLFAPARDRAVQRIRQHLHPASSAYQPSHPTSSSRKGLEPAAVEILLGDFNAEPHEPALKSLLSPQHLSIPQPVANSSEDLAVLQEDSLLSGASALSAATEKEVDARVDMAGNVIAATASKELHRHDDLEQLVQQSSQVEVIDENVFADAWVVAGRSDYRRRLELASNDENDLSSADDVVFEEDSAGFTFPACRPVKRIDFILYRSAARVHSDEENEEKCGVEQKVWARSARVIGKEPTADTAHLVGSREDLGMLDLDSPIWASDHFGLVADFDLY